jgi:hypothetical protein
VSRHHNDHIAQPLGIGLIEAAHGIHAVANANMTKAVKAVTTYRGRDPGDFSLLAFGGNGGVRAAGLAPPAGELPWSGQSGAWVRGRPRPTSGSFRPQFRSPADSVIDRGGLGLPPLHGPIITEGYEGTAIVPPDGTARLGPAGTVLIALAS